MRILVTGGAGFIGSHLVDKLISQKNEVAIIDDLSTGRRELINPQAIFYQLSINDDLSAIWRDFKPEMIYHLAAQSSVAVSLRDPVADAKINIMGSLNLFEYCLEACHSDPTLDAGEESQYSIVRKVIFVSSGGTVYGVAKKIPTSETASTNPESPYAVAKLAVEKYLTALRISHTILRLSNVYGPRQDPQGEAGAIAIFIGRILAGDTPIIFGTGQQTRDYVFVDDVVSALLLATQRDVNGPINIGTAKETSVLEILRLIDSTAKPKFAPARPGELSRSCLDVRLAKKLLGWQPKVSLAQGIQVTKDYFKVNNK